jgi:5-(carboxyamino)imidazole ribonucleotide mutase
LLDRTPDSPGAQVAATVLGVPVKSRAMNGLDSLLSIVQMPRGIPVATLAIGKSGAVNAALLAAAILANKYPAVATALDKYRAAQTAQVLEQPDPREAI